MADLANGFSFVMYEYDPANLTRTVPFPFLHQDDIRVFIGDPTDYVEVAPTWVNATQLSLPTQTNDGVPIPSGMAVTLRRFTERGAMLVNFTNGGQLPGSDLNLAARQLLYIIQESIDFGSYGGTGLPGGGVGWPPTSYPTDPAIQEIVDAVTASDSFQAVVAPIPEIDTNAEVVLQELLRSNDYFDSQRLQGNQIAQAFASIQTIQDDTSSFAQEVDGLTTRMDSAEADIISVQTAISDETAARASAITQVESDFKAADDSLNQSITTMVAETYATPDQAAAIAETKVDALANGAVAHIEERFDAMAAGTADPDGAFSAVWSIRINASEAGGKPVIGGIGLGVDPVTGSSFIVQADQFAIIHPNYTAGGTLVNVHYPFVVGTVGGVTQVGIDGDLVVDNSITARHIDVDSLSAISANAGTINGGTFKTHTLDANGNVISPNEFRVEITNVSTDTWPLWIGSGVKNENNAVFWVDRSGNASFDGTVQAPNIMGQLQKANSMNWTGTIYSTTTPNSTDNFVLDAPIRVGELHTPVLFVTVQCQNTFVDAVANGDVVIQKLVGGSWVDFPNGTSTPYFSKQEQKTITMVINDSPTTSAETYRVQLRPGNQAGFQATAVSFFGMGFR